MVAENSGEMNCESSKWSVKEMYSCCLTLLTSDYRIIYTTNFNRKINIAN